MTSLLKKFGYSVVLLSALTGLVTVTACTEEDEGDSDVPKIYEEIEYIYENLGNQGSCTNIQAALTKYTDARSARLSAACKDYREDLTKAKKPTVLAEHWQNSGYTLAAYIHGYNMRENLLLCTAGAGVTGAAAATMQNNTQKQFIDLFTNHGCDTFLDDAEDIVRKRGK